MIRGSDGVEVALRGKLVDELEEEYGPASCIQAPFTSSELVGVVERAKTVATVRVLQWLKEWKCADEVLTSMASDGNTDILCMNARPLISLERASSIDPIFLENGWVLTGGRDISEVAASRGVCRRCKNISYQRAYIGILRHVCDKCTELISRETLACTPKGPISWLDGLETPTAVKCVHHRHRRQSYMIRDFVIQHFRLGRPAIVDRPIEDRGPYFFEPFHDVLAEVGSIRAAFEKCAYVTTDPSMSMSRIFDRWEECGELGGESMRRIAFINYSKWALFHERLDAGYATRKFREIVHPCPRYVDSRWNHDFFVWPH